MNKGNAKDCSIDFLWDIIKEVEFPLNVNDEMNSLKNEIIWSIYSSIYYTTIEPMKYQDIFQAYKESDPASKSKEESADSENSILNTYKSRLKKDFSSGTHLGQFNMSGQYIENNTLLYFSSFWETSDQTMKVFNPIDFLKYLKGYTHWPYLPSNGPGMFFDRYFNFIQDCFEFNTKTMNTKPKENLSNETKFNNYFSSYIMEQLFYPEHFIMHIEKFLNATQEYFSDTEKPMREQAIILTSPFLYMPICLWEKIEDEYYNSMNSYIHNRRDISLHFNFQCVYYKAIFYQYILFPMLQSIFSMTLFKVFDSDLNKIREQLKEYMITNLNNFDCYSPLQSKLKNLDKIVFYNKKAITAPREGIKNNTKICSFEINFSHYFFVNPKLNNFYRFKINSHPNISMDYYLGYFFNFIEDNIEQIHDSISTHNYIDFLNKSKKHELDHYTPYMKSK